MLKNRVNVCSKSEKRSSFFFRFYPQQLSYLSKFLSYEYCHVIATLDYKQSLLFGKVHCAIKKNTNENIAVVSVLREAFRVTPLHHKSAMSEEGLLIVYCNMYQYILRYKHSLMHYKTNFIHTPVNSDLLRKSIYLVLSSPGSHSYTPH